MSSDFKPVLIEDDRLHVTDEMAYGVFRGGQNVTYQQFPQVGSSTSSCVFNVQVPSEQTIISREVLWSSTVELEIKGTPANGAPLLKYGLTDALGPFPLHSLCSVMTATVNNNTVSMNMRDLLPVILRMNDNRTLQRYNGYAPTAYDTVGAYKEADGWMNNPLAGWNVTGPDNNYSPRGAWKLDSTVYSNVTGVGDGVTEITATIKFTVTEPLLLSPFIFGNPESNSQGFYGIQNMNFVFNIADTNRVWRSARRSDVNTTNDIKSVVLKSFSDNRLLMNFLTTKPSQYIPARNVVPYYSLQRYLTTNLGALAAGGSGRFSTSNLQLNSIPDKIILCARKAMGLQTWQDPDKFLIIKNVSVNFNNSSGLLASATQQDLYKMSICSGSNQSWYEFSGSANVYSEPAGGGAIPDGKVGTSGSLVVLTMGKDIQLTEDFYSQGSIGQFSLQINVEVENPATGESYSSGEWELMLVTMQSGAFVNERGTSSTYTAMLTKQLVLDASKEKPVPEADVRRIVGGGFLDDLKSTASKIGKYAPTVAKMACRVMGEGETGAGMAGAGLMSDALSVVGLGKTGKKAKKMHPLDARMM